MNDPRPASLGDSTFLPRLQEAQQRSFCFMKPCSSVLSQILSLFEVMINYFAAFESIEYLRAYISRSAHRRRVPKNLRRFLDCSNDLSLFSGARFAGVGAHSRKRARANQSAGPRAKVLGREPLSHHFLYILVDVSPPDVDKLVVSVLILEDFFCRVFQQRTHDSSYRTIAQFPVLIHLTLSWERKLDEILFHFDVFRAKSSQSVASIFIGVDLAPGAHETG